MEPSGDSLRLQENSSTRVTCISSKSRPPAKIVWHLDDNEINATVIKVIYHNNSDTYETMSSIVINGKRLNNDKTVLCSTMNGRISMSKNVSLAILCKYINTYF